MPKGLVNLGNTCYFNSALQCLLHVPSLSNRFLRDGEYTGECTVTREYSKLVRMFWNKTGTELVHPRDVLHAFIERCPQFKQGQQHDTHEAVLALLDIFEKSLGNEYIKTLFYGTEVQVVTYPNGMSRRENDIMSLFVEQSLNDYSKYEYLTDYVDDAGRRYNVAALHTELKSLGHCLPVTFMQKCKVKDIPEEFQGMKLFALVIHWGIALGGHYYVFVKHKGQWRLTDDDSIQDVDKPHDHVPCSMAWYKKVT